jgi:hypothetical protein
MKSRWGGSYLARIRCVAIAVAMIAAATPIPGWAGEPVALVLEETGAVTPGLQPYSEIPASTRVRLDHDATLVFLDYNSCMNVTVTGGRVEFTSDGYKVEGGKNTQRRVACPGKLALAHGGEVSANTLRGADEGTAVTIPVRPSFALIGKHRDDFAEVRLTSQGRDIATMRLVRRHGDWPAGVAPLSEDTAYELIVVPKDAASTSIKFNVRTSSSSVAGGQALVLVGTD